MGKKFKDIQELQDWVEEQKKHSLQVASPHSQQIRDAWIPKSLYDRVIVTITALGFSKTDAAKGAIADFALIPNPEPLFSSNGLFSTTTTPTRNYRFSCPQELLWKGLGALPLVYSMSDIMSVAMRLWCDRFEAYTEEWLFLQGRSLDLTRAELIELIYSAKLLEAREKRLTESLRRGYLVVDPKLD